MKVHSENLKKKVTWAEGAKRGKAINKRVIRVRKPVHDMIVSS